MKIVYITFAEVIEKSGVLFLTKDVVKQAPFVVCLIVEFPGVHFVFLILGSFLLCSLILFFARVLSLAYCGLVASTSVND